jgi:CheY-like chemotaxis protein
VVDDNVDAGASMTMLLRLKGHQVFFAHDGQTALELAAREQPAIIFLDLGMPVMDGYEVARRIRSNSALADVKLIALTGWGQPDDRRRTASAGFSDHLVKPVDLTAIEALLDTLSASQSSRD